MEYKHGQWGKDGQISQVNEPSQIDLITICQIHDCHNPAYKIFAMGKEFYYGYCKDHQELGGKEMFYSFAMKPDTNSLNIDQILVNPEIKYYADWESALKIKKATLEPTEPESEPLIEGEVFLYHLIYRVGPTTYHFSVIAKNEADAKEKIISAKKYDYDKYFPDEIRKLRAHKNLGDVLSIYEKVG